MSKLVLRNAGNVILITLVNIFIVTAICFFLKFNSLTYYKYGLFAISGLYFLVFIFSITRGSTHYNRGGCSYVNFYTDKMRFRPRNCEGISYYKLYNFEIRMISIFITTALIALLF